MSNYSIRSINGLRNKAVSWLIGDGSANPVKASTIEKGYQNNAPSIADWLAFVEFCDQRQLFLFNDGISVGSGFELGSIAAEAASPEYLNAVFNKVRETFAYVVPMHQHDPWVMQIFVADDYDLSPVLSHIEQAIEPDILNTPFTQDYLTRLNDLFLKMARPEGLFLDPKTVDAFRGRRRRIWILFYRRYQTQKPTRMQAIEEHEAVIEQVQEKLLSPGLTLKRLNGKAYYNWLVKWFNPKPALTDGDVTALLKSFPYPDEKPASFCFPQAIFFTPPQSDDKGFVFDGMIHRILYVDGLKEVPEIGLLSREKAQSNPKHRYALLDKLPQGAMFTMTVVFSHDEALDAHLLRLENGIIGTALKPSQARQDIKIARDELAAGNRLYWVNQAVFYRADDEAHASKIEKSLMNLFRDAKMPLIDSVYDLHPLNSYLNALPFSFVPTYAKKHLCYDRLMYASELAALLPVYGRNQGARHLPCFTFFNRLGEPVLFDILHPDFITQNSHFALFSNSGGGKSVAMGWIINALMATKNARIVLFEMGNSFDRVLVHAKAYGKKTKQLLFSNQRSKAIPLNPFCEAYKAIPEISENLTEEKATLLAEKMMRLKSKLDKPADIADFSNEEESRSYLSELSLALRTMITEANPREEENFTLADETLLIEVLTDAILTSFKDDVPQMLTEHVLQAFARRLLTEETKRKKDRLLDMHDRLKSYVINSSKSRFFNVPTEPLGDFDIFHIDVSAIKDDKGKLALVMVSLLPRILAMAEATQHTNRPTFLFIDEAHIQFQLPPVVSSALLVAKVARKLGLWLVPSTQNVADMSGIAMKILSLIETWMLLGIDEKELADVQKFKQLTPEQIELIRNIDSQKGLYAEAVLLGSKYQGLFRVIPPRYLLALLMNEKAEKAARHAVESQHDVLQAAEIMAEQLENPVKKHTNERFFYDE